MASPYWILTLLFVACFSLAARLQVWLQDWAGSRSQSSSLASVILGDSQRAVAKEFFVEADVYFHGGYYPSIFDQAAPKTLHVAEQNSDQGTGEHAGHKELDDLPDFLKPPTDWIDRLGRYFYPSRHLHPEKPEQIREILPWMLFSAKMDPHRATTYTVAAYWLRTMGKVKEAEQFLRSGLQANPGDPDILFELGLLVYQRHDIEHARNLWQAALREWQARAVIQPEPDKLLLAKIANHLARMEQSQGNDRAALAYLKILKPVAGNPELIQKEIEQLEQKLAAPK